MVLTLVWCTILTPPSSDFKSIWSQFVRSKDISCRISHKQRNCHHINPILFHPGDANPAARPIRRHRTRRVRDSRALSKWGVVIIRRVGKTGSDQPGPSVAPTRVLRVKLGDKLSKLAKKEGGCSFVVLQSQPHLRTGLFEKAQSFVVRKVIQDLRVDLHNGVPDIKVPGSRRVA